MTEIDIQNSIDNDELPKDELDSFGDNFFYFLLLFIFLFIANGIFLLFILLLIFYTFYSKFHEKKLTTLITSLNQLENIELIKKIAAEQNWKLKTENNGFYEFYIPFLFNQPGHKLTLIVKDNKVLLNLRNIGSSRGRMPYLFGIDTFKERSIINLLQ